jgi:signal transduction histidine kinase
LIHWCLISGLVAAGAVGASAAETNQIITVAELQRVVREQGRAFLTFQLEAVVSAVSRNRGLVAVRDESETVLLELPAVDSTVRPGHGVLVEGKNCSLTRGPYAIQIGTAPIVAIDGRHPPTVKSGGVHLEPGMQPIRVEWFNGISGGALRLEYEGPGVARQQIPNAALWRRAAAGTGLEAFTAGVAFAAYEGERWADLPDFSKLQPVTTGTAPNLEISRRTRPEEAGLVFTGFLQISNAGRFTFYLDSDDGARVWIGNPTNTCALTVVDPEVQVPETRKLQQALTSRNNDQWVVTEGRVTFANQREGWMELELNERGLPVPVIIADSVGLTATNLLQQRVRVTGICQVAQGADLERTARLIVVGKDQVEVLGPVEVAADGPELLMTAEQIRRLQPAEARRPLRGRIRGVVTMVTAGSLVLQDATGGVFIHYYKVDWVNQPRVGELWEIEGTTDPGEFSPVIRAEHGTCLGSAALPEPIRPTWEQLMNGSLDAEQVEIQGVVTDIATNAMVLLTRDGRIRINHHEYYPLTQVQQAAATGSVVRVRGVFTANWDGRTGQVRGGEIYLGNAALSVDEATPQDAFAAPLMSAREMLLFTSHASALKRVKVAGQVLHALPHEYLLFDGTNGLRLLMREPLALQAGDQLEAVGFPRLGGPSPMLLEAQARKTGRSKLPEPVAVPAADLPSARRDATRVRVEALLLSDTLRREERVLEMQAGPNHFLARLQPVAGTTAALPRGSRLQVTGVYSSAREDRAGRTFDSFELLLGHAGDIVVLQQGPWWTVRHTIAVIAILSGGLLLALGWVTLLRRTVALRTAQLKTEIEERQLVEQRRVMEEERTRVAQDLHDELGAGLTEVDILGALVQNPQIESEKKQGYLGELREVSRSLVAGLDEIVWAVNPRYDSVADLAGYYSLFAQRFLNLAGITCRLRVAESIPEHPLDSRLRHGIFLAFKEVLNNVVRHAQATEVELAIGVVDQELKIAVADNGRGFQGAGANPGSDGVTGMKQRMQKLGGDCRIHSEPGRGTTVELRLPLGRNHS